MRAADLYFIMPGKGICKALLIIFNSKPIFDWIASNLENVRVNVMAQYRPMYQASEYPEINQPLKTLEFF